MPQGRAKLRLRVTELLAARLRRAKSAYPQILIEDMQARWQALDDGLQHSTPSSQPRQSDDEAARRLTSIPGIGALNATALVAAVGDARTFARSRDLAAWLGLVPRQATTGGKPRLLGITKRGSKYLRKMLIQGARAALPTLSRQQHPARSVAAWAALRERIPTRSLLRSPPRWRASSGRCLRHGATFEDTRGRLNPRSAGSLCAGL